MFMMVKINTIICLMHKKARKLQYSNNRHKGKNMWLENRVKQLEGENENLKTSLESLEKTQNKLVCKKTPLWKPSLSSL